tara:strand:+ start:409 stop:615 length:207 start_codon:yes stop_codon:yes gene_type:complete
VPSKKLDVPPSDQIGGIKASIKEIFIGSNGLYGATISAKAEQIKIIKKIEDEIIAILELKKLYPISVS